MKYKSTKDLSDDMWDAILSAWLGLSFGIFGVILGIYCLFDKDIFVIVSGIGMIVTGVVTNFCLSYNWFLAQDRLQRSKVIDCQTYDEFISNQTKDSIIFKAISANFKDRLFVIMKQEVKIAQIIATDKVLTREQWDYLLSIAR